MNRPISKFLLSGLLAVCAGDALAAVVASYGPGSAVTTVAHSVDFELNVGLANPYEEDGLVINAVGSGVNACGYAGCVGHPGFVGFTGNYHYVSDTGGAYISIRRADNSDFSAIEFFAGTGFFAPVYGYWQTYDDGQLTGSGTFAQPGPVVLGLKDATGFDEVRYFAFPYEGLTSGYGAPAVDTIRVGLVDLPPTAANLRLGFTGPTTPVRSGTTVPVYLRLDNYGPDAAYPPTVAFTSSSAIGSVSVTPPSGWSCEDNGDLVEARATKASPATIEEETGAAIVCTPSGNMARGTTRFNFHVTAPANPAGGFVSLNASVISESVDPIPGNNTASFKLYVKPSAVIAPVAPSIR